MASHTTEISVRVRYAETDQMGRAHHAHFLVWCEEARTAWLRERGLAYGTLEEEGIFLPVSRLEIRYRRPAKYDEEVRVRTWLHRARSRSLTMAYEITRADGRTLARAETQLVCVDGAGRPRRLPSGLRDRLLVYSHGRGDEAHPESQGADE